jgi:serine/threonine-protein kinase HipA
VAWQGRQLAALCSERFDRLPTPQGGAAQSVPFASFGSVLHSGNPARYLDRTDARMDDLPQLLRVASSQPAQDAQALYLRYLLALLTGNGDAHLDNWGMVGAWPHARLSPVYDPAPMRAFGYNCLSALGLGAHNVDWTLGYVPPDLAQRLADFAKNLGLRSDTAAKLHRSALKATSDYAREVHTAWNAGNPEPMTVFLHRVEQVRIAFASA